VATSRANLILHPVRMRLLAALGRRELTARQLGALLPDVPQATLYHHLSTLTRAGLLRVASERQVRGTVEKAYTLVQEHVLLSPNDLANASRDEHLHYFTVFLAMLLGDFARYLQQDGPIDLFADGAGYRETAFYLSDEEFAQAAAALNQALLPFLSYQPSPERRRRLMALIVFPDAESPDARSDTGSASSAPEE